ncbi:hypothetical protein D3C72_2406620 [compost metagenome]
MAGGHFGQRRQQLVVAALVERDEGIGDKNLAAVLHAKSVAHGDTGVSTNMRHE